MSYFFCFSCVDRSVRRSSIINVWAGEASVFEVPAGVSGEFPVFASFGRTSRSRRLDNRYFFVDFFSSVPWSKKWAVSCGVYLEC